MEMENSFGAMESSMKVNLQITESQDMVYIVGLTEVYIKVKLKTALDMGLVNTLLNKRPIKANGSKGKNKAREKLFLRAEVYLKDLLKMIWSKVMEKCTTILLEIILKANGKMTKNKVKVRWIGQISDRNMSVNGKTTTSKVGECIFGSSQKVKVSIFETDTKGTGLMESDKVMEFFIMQMALDTRDIGKTIWRKILHFIQMKMAKLS